MIRLGIIGLGTMGKHILAGALAHPSFDVLSIFDTRIQHLTAAHLSGEQYQAIQLAASQWLDSPEQGGFLREVFSHFVFIHQRMFGPQSLLSSEVDYSKPLKSETSVKAHYVSAAPTKLPMSLTGRVDSSLEEGVQWTLYLKPESNKPEQQHSDSQRNLRAIRFQNWDSLLIGDDNGQWQSISVHNQGSVETQLNEVEKMFRGESHRLASFAEALAVQQVVEATLGHKIN
ncbi:hypothetical protein Sden_1423 [Shewanella denitrificans OS217]|jgi:1,5-anhydro-D-fructose reductase (1,5-anhydro-D-mannitol-forming)|uniref:Uncharacterized protein n=1 Tax=Shewanella denitrificans (strain OS217 / ATCC BAA-1090 / DSM 15013) TaxID=318161 RepID=Q12PB7_SHEDO|nr:hypothetical protein [Shewanella denitrificans]ABE54709.1 hypothetical protein Sden_1423 [Shewanella denitrificans OS217]